MHGGPARSGYHGCYRQHQDLPQFVSDGASGFPRAAAVRDGIVTQRRAGGSRRVRSVPGRAVPGLYEGCAGRGLPCAPLY